MMVKVMNKQAAELPRAETPAHPADKLPPAGKTKSKGEQEFDAQLAAMAQIMGAQPIQPQPVITGAKAGGEMGSEKLTGHEKTMDLLAKAQKLKLPSETAEAQPTAQSLKLAASMNTGSDVAGLKKPSNPGLALENGSSPDASPLVTRGDADTALASKLNMLNSGTPWSAQTGFQQMTADAGAGMQPLTQAQVHAMAQHAQIQGQSQGQQPVQMDAAAAQDAALEAQLAAMGGVVQGLQPQVEGRSAVGAGGRQLLPGVKGRGPGGNAQAGLSGAEFLSALGAAKGGIVGSRFEQESQFPGEQNEGKTAGFGGKTSLHVIQGGGKDGKEGFETELTASQSIANLAANSATHAGTPMAAEVTGHVVQGANAEARLSSESLAGISTSLRSFSNQSAGGEMRIRLKPENLGELHVRVMTDGSNVGLHIQASDEKSKKILEESLSHLKESMASQNLHLGTVELTVAHSHGSAFSEHHNHQEQAPGQGMFNNMQSRAGTGQSNGQGDGRGGAWGNSGEGTGFARTGRPAVLGGAVPAQAFGQARAAYAAGSGRLDVTA